MQERTRSDASQQLVPKPKLITSDEKQEYYLNTDGSSDENSESDEGSIKRSRFSTGGQIIRTSELVAQSQALTVRPPGSPTSFKSSQGSYIDDDAVPRSIAYRPRKQIELVSTPSRPGQISIPKAKDRLGAGPIPEPVCLRPDAQGNEIPADAKWTKIHRRLVSPEVLEQGRMRYEA